MSDLSWLLAELDELASVIARADSTTQPLKKCHWLGAFLLDDPRNQGRLHYLMDLIEMRWREGCRIFARGAALRMVEAWRQAAMRDRVSCS